MYQASRASITGTGLPASVLRQRTESRERRSAVADLPAACQGPTEDWGGSVDHTKNKLSQLEAKINRLQARNDSNRENRVVGLSSMETRLSEEAEEQYFADLQEVMARKKSRKRREKAKRAPLSPTQETSNKPRRDSPLLLVTRKATHLTSWMSGTTY